MIRVGRERESTSEVKGRDRSWGDVEQSDVGSGERERERLESSNKSTS